MGWLYSARKALQTYSIKIFFGRGRCGAVPSLQAHAVYLSLRPRCGPSFDHPAIPPGYPPHQSRLQIRQRRPPGRNRAGTGCVDAHSQASARCLPDHRLSRAQGSHRFPPATSATSAFCACSCNLTGWHCSFWYRNEKRSSAQAIDAQATQAYAQIARGTSNMAGLLYLPLCQHKSLRLRLNSKPRVNACQPEPNPHLTKTYVRRGSFHVIATADLEKPQHCLGELMAWCLSSLSNPFAFRAGWHRVSSKDLIGHQ